MTPWPTEDAPRPFTGIAVDHPDTVEIKCVGDALVISIAKGEREIVHWISAPAKIHVAVEDL